MREDPKQDWLTSSRNHASADYDRDRLRETWTEAHSPSEKAQRRAKRRRRQRRRNRKPRYFGKVNWAAYEHRVLYDMIMRAEPARMYTRASEWSTLAGRIEETTGRVQQVVERVMGTWQGQAAVNAAAANTRLMRWAGTASHTAGRIAEGLANYTEAVESAQRRMPEPGFATAERNFRDGYTVTMSGGPSDAVFLRQLLTDAMVSHEQARSRKAEAVAVMESYEAGAKDVHDTMPQFTDAGPTTRSAPEWTPDADGPAPVPPSGGGPGWPGQAPTSPPVAGAAPPAGVARDTTNLAGFVDPSLPGAPGPGGSGPGGTGGGGGLGGGGFGGGPGSLNGGADAVRGGSGGGGFGALAGRGPGGVVGGPGSAGAGAAGARGGAGAFGGMPVGGGAGGEADTEHTNKYDEGLDLFDDLPPAYPPVFGA